MSKKRKSKVSMDRYQARRLRRQLDEAEEHLFREDYQQPQNSLGVCLLMQRRFDEAEAAFRRALEIDPDYKLARKQLKQLKKIRQTGKLPQIAVSDPYREAKITTHFITNG